MLAWNREITKCSRIEVIQYCVNDYLWQQFRLSLKGRSTREKLTLLSNWLDGHDYNRAAQVQVDNYLGALKRGGQISASGEVQK